jgi:molybdate transport system substrate-binding protein
VQKSRRVVSRLGIAKEIKAKSILYAWAATTPNAEIVARGEAELGIQLISEIVSVPGAELLGPLPVELQVVTVISAGIVGRDRFCRDRRPSVKLMLAPCLAVQSFPRKEP